ncbi:tetratricopeptide repeat protein [uncultured Dokdonia sp.]|uniref:tetratricopeptide repeat protein n=1 Tax=uncultured Dokdonia sp. TaxID=575653 RepID=UPI00260E1B06|nr:tetratricopeptide repeat protein [uncultured Dokdonia sp.]
MKKLFIVLVIGMISKVGAQAPALAVADSLYATGEYTKAIAQYEKIQEPTARIWLQIARAYKGKGAKTAALNFYKKSLELNDKQPIAATEYGRLLLTKSKFKEADSVFSILSTRYPTNAEYHYQWGRALKKTAVKDTLVLGKKVDNEKIDTSEKAFAKAVQLDSTHQKAMFELAKYHLGHKNYPEVEAICKKALESEPENIEIIGVLAQNYYYKGWWIEAIDLFNQLLDMGVDTLFVRNKLGRAYYEKRMYPEAIEAYEEVLAYDDEDWGTLITLARLYNFNREYNKAINHGIKALKSKDLPLDDVYYTMGRSFEFKKNFPEAMKHYQRAVKEDPYNFDALYAIAVAADNYYEDKEEVLALYEKFVSNFENVKRPPYIKRIADDRIVILKREIFEAQEKKE